MKHELIIYQNKSGAIELKSDFEKDTLWANQAQIAELFEIDRSVATRHINNIFKDEELDKKVVCARFAHTTPHGALKGKTQTKKVEYYNLDIILAVGYRANSSNAIKFRQWATSILKKHIIHGYTINENRLKTAQKQFNELQSTIALLAEKSKTQNLKGQEAQILNLLKEYSNSLTFLEQFDKNKLPTPRGNKSSFVLKYEEAKNILVSL